MPPNRGPVWQAVQYSVSCDNLVVQSRVTVHSTSEFEVVLGIPGVDFVDWHLAVLLAHTKESR